MPARHIMPQPLSRLRGGNASHKTLIAAFEDTVRARHPHAREPMAYGPYMSETV